MKLLLRATLRYVISHLHTDTVSLLQYEPSKTIVSLGKHEKELILSFALPNLERWYIYTYVYIYIERERDAFDFNFISNYNSSIYSCGTTIDHWCKVNLTINPQSTQRYHNHVNEWII